MRNSYQNTTNYKQVTNSEKLVLVRTGILYGLSFEKVKQESTTFNNGITSIPTMLFLNNNTQCFFDFTTQTNKDLESKIETFFAKVAPLTTFTVSNAYYYNTNTEDRADLSGQYVFTEYFNGIIKANVTSVATLTQGVTRYDKKFFEEIPLIKVNSLIGTETKDITVIRNLFGANTKNSFNYLGIQTGDFISFSEANSKYEVIEITTDPNGIETIKVKGTIDILSLIDTKVLINVYIRYTDQYSTEPDINEMQLGACVQTQNGVVIKCMENHTLSQCRFRSSFNNQIDATISFDSFCATPETDTAVEKTNTDKLIEITNMLATNIAKSTSSISNIAGPINRNGNSRTGFYGRG